MRTHTQSAILVSILALGACRAARGDETRLGGHVFSLPEGFAIEPATELLPDGAPLVARPITAAFGEDGRLYVSDSAGVRYSVHEQLEKKPHRVVRLEDRDGDGRFESRAVFAEGLMFPEGTMWLDGSLYVAAPPSIWKLTDADGDGVCDRREEWFQGKTLTGCANDLHGPYLGLDGRIYWAKGAFAEQTYARAGRDPFITRAAHIFRARQDGSEIEAVMTGGMDNPVDVVFTAGGERIFTTTFFQHPAGGKRDGLIHAVYGGVWGKEHDVLRGHPRTGDLMPVLTHLGAAAPCGLEVYRSRAFGEGYTGNLFAALFNLHKVTRHVLRPDGATFRSEDSDFLVSDNLDFHPTDVIEDADGSLLVVDTGGWYKICCPTSQLSKPDVLGAIYRVRRAGAARPDDPRGRGLEWGVEAEALAARLGDARPAVRDRALAGLAALGGPAVPPVRAVLRGGGAPASRLHAVWALSRIEGGAARAAVRAALDGSDETVRLAALSAVSLWRDPEALPDLERSLESGSAALQRAAAEALGRIGDPAAVPALLAACAAEEPPPDRALEHSLIYALIEIGDPAATRMGLRGPSPRLQRAAFIALDQMEGGGLTADIAASYLTADSPLLREAAAWVLAHRPEWGSDLVDLLETRIRAPAPGPGGPELEGPELEVIEELEGLLVGFAREAPVQKLLARAALDRAVAVPVRRALLRAMARSGVKEAPAAWTEALAALIAQRDDVLIADAVAAARRLAPVSDSQPPEAGKGLASPLLDLARDPGAPPGLRLEALAAAPGELRGEDLGPETFLLLLESLDPETPVAARSAATSVLVRTALDPREKLALIARLRTAGPLEVNALLPAFEKLDDEALALELILALEASPGGAGLRPDALAAWLEKAPAPARERGARLLAALDEDREAQRSQLEALAAGLQRGDVRRGQRVFQSPRAACASCHAVGYLGGRLGPDLTGIGKVRSERDLLESILYPSMSFVRSYEPLLVVSREGEAWNGILRADTPEELVLATGAETEVRIPRAAILEVRPGTVSVMPAGVEKLLTPEEIADLVAFLKAPQE